MKHMIRGIAGLLVVLVAALVLCGCGTVRLDKVSEFSDDRVGYLVAGALEQSSRQHEYAVRVADEELGKRSASLRPEKGVRNIELWIQYGNELEQPILIDADVYRNAPDLQNVKDLGMIEAYVESHPEKLKISGEVSVKWHREVVDVNERVSVLDKEFSDRVADGEALLKDQRCFDAADQFRAALDIRPSNAQLVSRIRQCADYRFKWLTTTVAEQQLEKAQVLEKAFGKPGSSHEQIGQCVEVLDAMQRKITEFKREVSSDARLKPLLSQKKTDLLELNREINLRRGRCWVEGIELYARRKEFWRAYRYTAARIDETRTNPLYGAPELRSALEQAYSKMLPDAMEYYVAKANESYACDSFGTASVLCFMVREMIDYARCENIEVSERAATLEKRTDEPLEDATKKIHARLSRRLLILDFAPAVTDEGESFAYQIRVRCNKAYGSPNNLVWALEVPMSRKLEQQNIKPVKPLDCVLLGRIGEISVTRFPVEELDRQVVPVGSSTITEIRNPLFDIKREEPRTVFSQEVLLFQKIRKRHRRGVRIELRVTYGFDNLAHQPLYDINTSFTNLPNVVMQSEETTYDPPFLGTPRTSHDARNLKVDPWPKAVSPVLSSEKDMQRAILDIVLEEIIQKIDLLVARFPLTDLAARAMEEQDPDSVAATEYMGQCLLYCYKLTESEFDRTDRPGWIALRKQLVEDVDEWCGTRWRDQDPKLLDQVRNIWNSCVESVLRQVVDQEIHDGKKSIQDGSQAG